MSPAGRRRLGLAATLLVGTGALGFVAFGNMGESLVYYWSPRELVEHGDDAVGATVRLGGLVVGGTVDWRPESQSLRFSVTDGKATVPVLASGAPPQMFREDIGVLVEGRLGGDGVFVSDRVMVKHSNEYRVPEEGATPQDIYSTVDLETLDTPAGSKP